ncbi:hypothetical protein [Streptomyces gilvosporeus]|uniref:Uncharacterized protein n=1 Tax=Streptomyces gilvosporeus TaxID=553510 RepID=A0A1V0TLN2_9ACTN|nr:hypothetical protein [Streptomyces gilvosporeus]ARF53846.1 hypothetical protein B1H19_06340 [Streptomyces gilvosporeus]
MGHHERAAGTEAAPAEPPPRNRARIALGAVLVLVILTAAGLVMRLPLDDFRYTTGLSGTPGTFTAARCHTVGSGRSSSRTCTGTYVAAHGGFTARTARMDDGGIEPGRPVRVQREADGSYVRPLTSGALEDVAGAFLITSVAAFLLLGVCVSSPRVVVEGDAPLRANPRPWRMALSVLLTLSIGGGVAGALAFAAGFVMVLTGH